MAGYTHVAFRQMVAEYGGCGLMFSEMCSAKALP
ncbi:MAG: tRNA-dihydrouridine synthase, partial [Desulfosalsimonas sp.]